MYYIKYFLVIAFIGSLAVQAKAQSSNFSQYHLTPVFSSPGEFGTSDYLQVLGHYRKQSLSAQQGFENIAVSGIYPLFYKGNGRRFGGVGVGIMKEASGMLGLLNETSFTAGYAYNWQVNEIHHISFGLQGGYFRRSIDVNKVRTESQYQHGVYDPGMSLGENLNGTAGHTFKADAGVNWYVLEEDGDHKVSVGLAAFNLNRADYRYLSTELEKPEPVRYLLYGSMKAYSLDKLHLKPTFRLMFERNYVQANVGALFLYQFQEKVALQDNNIGLGLWYSVNNAVLFSLQMVQPSYVVSISYDLPAASKIMHAQVNNGVEVTLGWRLKRQAKKE